MTTFVLGSLLCLSGFPGLGQAPEISGANPRVIHPTQANRIQLSGKNLDNPASVWSSFGVGGVSFESGGQDRSLQLDFEPESGIGSSIEILRLATEQGVSNPVLFYLDELPMLGNVEAARERNEAKMLKVPSGVEGRAKALQFNYYRIQAREGQSLAFEIVANRLGSAMDPVLRVLDSNGREAAFADDTPGLLRDCFLRHRFSSAGEYFLELRDVEYEGGSDYFYYLRVGDLPSPALCYPAAASPRIENDFRIIDMDGIKRSEPIATGAWNPETGVRAHAFSNPSDPSNPGGHARQYRAAFPAILETEPNDAVEFALELTSNVVVNGRFESAGDVDFYRIPLVKNQRVRVNAESRRFGSACDVFMELLNDRGTRLKSMELEGKDSILEYESDRGQTAWLRLEELNRRGAPDFLYVCEIRIEEEGGFDLTCGEDRIAIPRGGETELKIECERRGYDGPIEIVWEGSASFFEVIDGVLPEKKKQGAIKLKAKDGARPGEFAIGRLIGKARINGREISTAVGNASAVEGHFPQMLFPPMELSDRLFVSVVDEDKP